MPIRRRPRLVLDDDRALSERPIASATGRPTISATPPGGNGTISAIGFDGYVS
jgi:hypothetical protein